jgi:hypothetical protein
MNEFLFGVISYLMVIFSDFVKVTEQYNMGFSVVGIISLFLLINMSTVLTKIIKSICLIVTLLYKKVAPIMSEVWKSIVKLINYYTEKLEEDEEMKPEGDAIDIELVPNVLNVVPEV